MNHQKHFHRLIIVILLLHFLSCGEHEEQENVISVNEAETELLLTDIAEEIEEIKLEITDSSLIGQISKVAFTEQHLFVFESAKNRVMKFDRDGTYISSIGSIGEGPKEHQFLTSFTINEKHKEIYLLAAKKILKYDFDGNFLQQRSLEKFQFNDQISFVFNRLTIFNSTFGHKFDSSDQFYNLKRLTFLDRNFKLIESRLLKIINVDREVGVFAPMTNFLSGNENEYYLYLPVLIPEKIVRDSLYRFSSNNTTFYKKINFQSFNDPNSSKKNINIKSIIKEGPLIIADFNAEGRFTFVYDERNQKKYLLKGGFKSDDYLEDEYIFLKPILNRENKLYFTGKAVITENRKLEPNPSIFIISLKG